jgi:hypothetical protein
MPRILKVNKFYQETILPLLSLGHTQDSVRTNMKGEPAT